MAGFEVVVRPVTLPDIRPPPARSLPPADDPEKGFCEIKGNPAKTVSLSNSYSRNMSKSRGTETQRRVDVARVYQKDSDGKINRDNFVDIEVANRIKMKGGKQPSVDGSGPGSGTPGVGSGTPGVGSTTETNYYTPVEPKDNIEIKEKDKIIEGR